ncbi:hypothetical protein [Komagataeibacter europaeus]|uniref:hypothetical protein n=1 Tax=Komagataeibacter europaeus TaxID=33995 RepID=UPI001C713120|nr:hypothetical protein [Komagataeibacter europaeus]
MHPTTWVAAASWGVGAAVAARKTGPSAWAGAVVAAAGVVDNGACSAGDGVAPMPVPMAAPTPRRAG